jgi:hypothetical protein
MVHKKLDGFIRLDKGLYVGSVPIENVKLRKPRFRRMNRLQEKTLKSSLDKFGIKSLTLVRPVEGGYEQVDGHHRKDEYASRGKTHMPVVLFVDDAGKPYSDKDTDLAMMGFNVSADLDEEVWLDFMHETVQDVGADDFAVFASEDPEAVHELFSAIDFDQDEGPYNEAQDPLMEASSRVSERDSSRGQPLVIKLPGTDSVRDLLDAAMAHFDVTNEADAVLSCLELATAKKPKKSKLKRRKSK